MRAYQRALLALLLAAAFATPALAARSAAVLSQGGEIVSRRSDCREDDDCGRSEVCVKGECLRPKEDGEGCRRDAECASGTCQSSWWPSASVCITPCEQSEECPKARPICNTSPFGAWSRMGSSGMMSVFERAAAAAAMPPAGASEGAEDVKEKEDEEEKEEDEEEDDDDDEDDEDTDEDEDDEDKDEDEDEEDEEEDEEDEEKDHEHERRRHRTRRTALENGARFKDAMAKETTVTGRNEAMNRAMEKAGMGGAMDDPDAMNAAMEDGSMAAAMEDGTVDVAAMQEAMGSGRMGAGMGAGGMGGAAMMNGGGMGGQMMGQKDHDRRSSARRTALASGGVLRSAEALSQGTTDTGRNEAMNRAMEKAGMGGAMGDPDAMNAAMEDGSMAAAMEDGSVDVAAMQEAMEGSGMGAAGGMMGETMAQALSGNGGAMGSSEVMEEAMGGDRPSGKRGCNKSQRGNRRRRMSETAGPQQQQQQEKKKKKSGRCVQCIQDKDCADGFYCERSYKKQGHTCLEYGPSCDSYGDCNMGEYCDSAAKRCRPYSMCGMFRNLAAAAASTAAL